MIEVLVGQHHMSHPASGDLSHVGGDRLRFGQRGAGVDEQYPGTALHQTDSDVEEGQPATMHAIGQLHPVEVHTRSRGCWAKRRRPVPEAETSRGDR